MWRRIWALTAGNEWGGFGIAGAVAAIIGAIVSGVSQYQQGQFNQAVAKNNAKIAEQQATYQQQLAAAQAHTQQQKYRALLGKQAAQVGGSGVTTEGSPLMVMLESETQAALDVGRIKSAGLAASMGLENEAKISRYKGNQAAAAGTAGAGASLLRGGVEAAGMMRGMGGGGGYDPGNANMLS